MTNLPEVADWVAGIYQIEQTDPVLGGPPNLETGAGIANVQAQQLAERTAWLKAQIAAAVAFVIATGTGLSGGGAIDGGLTLSADLADQAVAEAGSNNLQLMTALRTRQAIEVAINALVGAAPAQLDTLNELATAITENGDTSAALTALIASKFGTADLATQVEAEAGTNNTKLMTPLRATQAIAVLTPTPVLVGLVPLAVIDLAGDSTAEFTAFDDALYVDYVFAFRNVVPSVNASRLRMRLSNDGGSSYLSGATDYETRGSRHDTTSAISVSASGFDLTVGRDCGNDANRGLTGDVTLIGSHRADYTSGLCKVANTSTSAGLIMGTASLRYEGTAEAHDAAQFFFDSGTLATGSITMYGRRKSV